MSEYIKKLSDIEKPKDLVRCYGGENRCCFDKPVLTFRRSRGDGSEGYVAICMCGKRCTSICDTEEEALEEYSLASW